jgi:hypothetical protein
MNIPVYELTISEDRLRYEFISVGSKGQIHKIIEYTYLPGVAFWNLGFGDLDETTGHISDSVVSDNGDGRKVLATVIRSLLSFFNTHPAETIIFTGSDERRTRVYHRIAIQYQREFLSLLAINGLTEDGLEESIETDKRYLAFVIRKA